LVSLIKKFAWGPVMDMMQMREDYVANEIETAENNRQEAEQASKAANEQLQQTKQEATQIIEDAKSTGIKKEEDSVASDIKEAEKEENEQLQQTKQEAKQIIEDAKTSEIKQEEYIVASAKKEAERIRESAQADIESEKEIALQAYQDKVASLSVLVASKVIEKEISAEDQDELIAEYIKEVGEER